MRRRSTARLTTNQDYLYIKQDIDDYQKLQADRSATLNEREAIAQNEHARSQNKLRENEHQIRAVPDIKIYELTLQNVDDPGLPAPKSFYGTNTIQNYANFSVFRSFDTNTYVSFFTNSPGYSAESMTNYLESAHIEKGDAQLSFTNTPAALVPDQTVKPVVTKIYEADPALDETEHILEDYISLLPKGATVTVAH